MDRVISYSSVVVYMLCRCALCNRVHTYSSLADVAINYALVDSIPASALSYILSSDKNIEEKEVAKCIETFEDYMKHLKQQNDGMCIAFHLIFLLQSI